ncbi:MAG: KilA-N domain-containing protein [Lachnospiraceae bacterium]|nr:KilA-N domain-containing protein [Lachnospiraceae bacterium]
MAENIKKDIIHANGFDIGIYTTDYENEFISITDIAKYKSDAPNDVIKNWMRNRETLEFLGLWESLHNQDFKPVEFDGFKSEAGMNAFTMSPTKWIKSVNAIGIVTKAGRYGGTYAHSDIALEFASWISAEFKLYIMKDYQRLKKDENSRLSLNWNLNREIAKLNYRIHTDAIKDYLIPPELTPNQISYKYANEADLLNVALFGMTAKQWREKNSDKTGNIRDDATLNQLLVLANMESYNAILIDQGKTMSERLVLLRGLALKQMETLSSVRMDAIKRLPESESKMKSTMSY